ncbi:MAG: prenyltransferase/squalene oxidase repeat-containing protein [Candidatus Hodarchaeota archaeon]
MIEWIPDFSYFAYKVKNPINLAKSLGYIEEKIKKGDIFQSLDVLFWSINLIYGLDKQELLDKELIKKYILDLKHDNGGYKFSTNLKDPDIQSTFYCLAILKILGINELIEDKDINFILNSQNLGGFIHCNSKSCHINCKGRPSFEFSFYALSALSLLNNLEKVDQKKLIDHLKKETKDNIDLIYQILSLNLIQKFEITDFEKKFPTLTSWQLPQSGFGINTKFPSAEHTYWVGICLGLMNKLDLVNLEGIIDFLKGMQQDNGGFTGQYTSISSQKPTLNNTAHCIISLFYIWNFLIDEIENEILLRARDFSDIYLIPITEKFSISLNLTEEVAKWLISNDWFEGEIIDRDTLFEAYFKKQNQISQEIIDKIMKHVKSFQKQKELDLNELSKSFDFSNPLERVKIVVNDLIINKFLTGNVKAYKKKFILEHFALPGKYIHLTKPLSYADIMGEKKRMELDKRKLKALRLELIEAPRFILEKIQKIVEKEIISEANEKLKDEITSYKEKILKLENTMKKINSEYKLINFKFANFKFQKNWPLIKLAIEKDLNATELKIKEIIKKKEEEISKKSEEKKEQNAVVNLRTKIREIKKKLNLYQVEIKNFFPKNFMDHEKTLKLINSMSDFVNESDSNLISDFSNFSSTFQIDQFKKEIEEISSTWEEEMKNNKEIIKSYHSKIEKRIELGKAIVKLISELEKFSIDKNEQILQLKNDDKLDEGSKLLDDSIQKFKELYLKQIEAFGDFIKETNKEIPDFSKYYGDLESDWEKKLKSEEERWDNFVLDLKEKLHSSLRLEKKDEFDKKLKTYVEDIKSSLENMKKTVLDLLEANKIIDAGNNAKEMTLKIDEKIKTYNQDCKDFIRDSSREFKNFRETVNEIIEYWESECEKLTQMLEETRSELKKKINKKGSRLRKDKLEELINNQISEIDDKIDNFKLNFNQTIDFGKKLDEFEEKFKTDLSQIRNSVKSSDDEIKEYIKTASKIYDIFEEIASKEINYWNESKSSIENQLETLSEKVDDEILILKMQTVVRAFKDNKVDLSYLSKALKVKLESFKLKIIELISEKRLVGELDTSDIFILKEEVSPKKLLVEKVDEIKKEILRMRYLMVIHNEVGASVYNRQLGDWDLDPNLMSGFLSAIQTFSSEIKKKEIPMKRMEYKDFEIIMEQGDYILVALFIDGKESDWIRSKLKSYVIEFEKEYDEQLKGWSGELTTFRKSGFLVDKAFELFRV